MRFMWTQTFHGARIHCLRSSFVAMKRDDMHCIRATIGRQMTIIFNFTQLHNKNDCFNWLYFVNFSYLNSNGRLEVNCTNECLFSAEYHSGHLALRDRYVKRFFSFKFSLFSLHKIANFLSSPTKKMQPRCILVADWLESRIEIAIAVGDS